MNLNFLISITSILYVLNFIVSYTVNNDTRYLRYNEIDLAKVPYYVDYEDELIKAEIAVANNIHTIIMNNDYNNSIKYEININCYHFNNNTCNEFMLMKYNLTMEEQEIYIINYMRYIFDNITIVKKENITTNCCNVYLLSW